MIIYMKCITYIGQIEHSTVIKSYTNPRAAADDVWCSSFSDCEFFVSEILYDENLSENAQETRKVLLNNFRVVHVRLGISHFVTFSDSKTTLNLGLTL